MSASERAVIYVDSGSDLSSMNSISSISSTACSPSPPQQLTSSPTSSSSSSSRRALVKMSSNNGNNNCNSILVPHSEGLIKQKSSNPSNNNSNNFVIKIQIGEESTLFNPVRIDVATTKNGHHHQLHRIQHHHITTTTSTTSSKGTTTGKSILIAAASSASVEDDLSGASNSSSNSGQSSPRSDMTPPPSTITAKRQLLRFGSETSESDTESDISSLTDYQIARPSSSESASPPLQYNNKIRNGGGNSNLIKSSPASSCPAAQYVMREILGMTLDSTKTTKLEEEQNKLVEIKNNMHKTLMKSFSAQENGGYKILKPSLAPILAQAPPKAFNQESLNDEIKLAFQQRNAAKALQEQKKSTYPSTDETTYVGTETKGNTGQEKEDEQPSKIRDFMADVMRITKSNNKIVSFTPASGGTESDSIILDQKYFHLNEFNGKSKVTDGIEKRIDNAGLDKHTKRNNNGISNNNETLTRNFAGFKDIFAKTHLEAQNQIMSDNGTIRGVKNRVRDGIATFLQNKDIKIYNEKEQGRLVVYVTSMGVVRDTFQRCQKVKQILRTLMVKYDERDCYMNRAIQDEIRERLQLTGNSINNNNNNNRNTSTSVSPVHQQPFYSSSINYSNNNNKSDTSLAPPTKFQLSKSSTTAIGPNLCTSSKNSAHKNQKNSSNHLSINYISLPQVFLEGQHLGDADAIEKLNETGQLRDLLRPFKSLSVLSTCERCGGFRMLPCPVCNGSKKSVHRNHFTAEFVALKCMHCDTSGLVRCEDCNADDEKKRQN